jgi:hypothetical protein
MRGLIKNKKGDIPSLIVGLVVLGFVIALIALIAGRFIPELTSAIKDADMIAASNNSVAALDKIETNSVPWLDYFFFFTFIATLIGLIISSLFVDTHPAFLIIFVIILIVAIIFGGIFANAYNSIGESTALSATYAEFTKTQLIMNNLPLILFISGILVIIILYGKSKGGGMGNSPM